MGTTTVSNAAQLTAALKTVKAGDTILLKSGNYGDVSLKTAFGSNVNISAATGATVRFETLTLNGAKNVSFNNINFGRPAKAGEGEWKPMVDVDNSTNINFNGGSIKSSGINGATYFGNGMTVDTSTGITVKNMEMSGLVRGAVFDSSTNLTISSNNLHDIRSDGLDFHGVKSVLVDSNRIHDMFPAGAAGTTGDHPDAIQFFVSTNKPLASSDITITNNEIMAGKGGMMQGIFVQDETGKTPYKNVTIQNNLLYLANTWNGLTVSGAVGASITNNTVVSSDKDAINALIRLQNVTSTTVSGNVADDFDLKDGTSTVSIASNINLKKTPTAKAMMADINAGANATAASLMLNTSKMATTQSLATTQTLAVAVNGYKQTQAMAALVKVGNLGASLLGAADMSPTSLADTLVTQSIATSAVPLTTSVAGSVSSSLLSGLNSSSQYTLAASHA